VPVSFSPHLAQANDRHASPSKSLSNERLTTVKLPSRQSSEPDVELLPRFQAVSVSDFAVHFRRARCVLPSAQSRGESHAGIASS
jgi:hypothetical protein